MPTPLSFWLTATRFSLLPLSPFSLSLLLDATLLLLDRRSFAAKAGMQEPPAVGITLQRWIIL